jgi:hypothetical protein
MIVLSDNQCERIGKWEPYPRGPIVGVHLAGASVARTGTLLGVSRATVSKVMLAYMTHHGKITSAKRKSGRK